MEQKDVSDGHAAVLRVLGDVDLATAPQFQAQASELMVRPDLRRLTLDLSGVEFLDSSGIQMLTAVRSACLDRDVELVLGAPRERVVQLLRMTGTLEGFVIDPGNGS